MELTGNWYFYIRKSEYKPSLVRTPQDHSRIEANCLKQIPASLFLFLKQTKKRSWNTTTKNIICMVRSVIMTISRVMINILGKKTTGLLSAATQDFEKVVKSGAF